MKKNNIFLFIFVVSSLSGFFLSLINNDIYKEDNLQKLNITDNNESNKTGNNDTSKNNEDNEKSNKTRNNDTSKNNEDKEEKEKDNSIHVALIIDNRVIYQTLVFLTSLFENRNPTTIYDIIIMIYDNINKSYISKINSLKNK